MKPFKDYFIIENLRKPDPAAKVREEHGDEKYRLYCMLYTYIWNKFKDNVTGWFIADELEKYIVSKGITTLGEEADTLNIVNDTMYDMWYSGWLHRSNDERYRANPGAEIDSEDPDLFSDML